jgi:hypothetical protein
VLPRLSVPDAILPEERGKGKYDTSRAPATVPFAADICIAGRDDRAGLPRSADGAGWRNVAAANGHVPGTHHCSNDVRDRNANRYRRRTDTAAMHISDAAEQPDHERSRPLVVAGGLDNGSWFMSG